MSDEKAHIELISTADSDEWPEAVQRRLGYLSKVAENNDFSILCVVGLSYKTKNLSVVFSEKSLEMVDDIVDMFSLIAKRLKQ